MQSVSQHFIAQFAPKTALRVRGEDDHVRVTNMELFFDLVYVFSIIQVSHFLLEHQSWLGALQTTTLFAAVWWAWNYTAWATNSIDPAHPAGRALMIMLMACALLMAVAMLDAYGTSAGLFVAAYIAMALIRTGYMAVLFRGERMGQNYTQLCAWSGFSGIFWIAGVFLPDLRVALWLAAVFIDYAGPFAGFWLPRVGATPMASWTLAGLHLLERNQQVFIIALGESILLMGGTLVDQTLDQGTVLAATFGFLIIVTLWWLYFVLTTYKGETAFARQINHTLLVRSGLTYAHGIMVAGAIVLAVAIEEMIAHPSDRAHAPVILAATLGPTIYILGSAMFYRTMAERIPAAHLGGVVALAAVGYGIHAAHASALILGASVLIVLVVLTVVASGIQAKT